MARTLKGIEPVLLLVGQSKREDEMLNEPEKDFDDENAYFRSFTDAKEQTGLVDLVGETLLGAEIELIFD